MVLPFAIGTSRIYRRGPWLGVTELRIAAATSAPRGRRSRRLAAPAQCIEVDPAVLRGERRPELTLVA
jgi:hypothetical protein